MEIDLTQPVIDCNCSNCQIKGLLLAFVPAEQFKLLSGEEDLVTYKFNKGHIAHMHCRHCGVQPIGKGMGPKGPTVAINVRTIDDIDPDALVRKPFNGRDL